LRGRNKEVGGVSELVEGRGESDGRLRVDETRGKRGKAGGRR